MQSFASSSFSEIEYILFLFSITIRQKHDNKLGSSKCLYEFETLYFINKTFEPKNIRIKELSLFRKCKNARRKKAENNNRTVLNKRTG